MKKHNVYTYLEEIGILENGTDEEIQLARLEYWKKYKTEWKRNNRKSVKEITASFTKKEFEIITTTSKRYGVSRASFLKQAVLAYMNDAYVIPNKADVNHIVQLLAMQYTLIENAAEENCISDECNKEILQSLTKIESFVQEYFHHPKKLTELVENEIATNPQFKSFLSSLLLSS